MRFWGISFSLRKIKLTAICDFFLSSSSMEQPSAFIRNKVSVLISENKKLEAVKLVYEATKCSLKEAKEYVDDAAHHPFAIADSNTSAFQRDLDAEIMGYLYSNQKLQAVKVYKDFSGLGLAESKEYVEALERNGGVSVPPATASVTKSRDTEISDLLGSKQGAKGKSGATSVTRLFALVIIVVVVLYFILR